MANHDPISDMLTRIRNACEKRHPTTRIPSSRMCRSIAKVLQQEGFISEIAEEGEGGEQGACALPQIQRQATPALNPLSAAGEQARFAHL